MKEILEKIKQYKRIIIHGHIRPDGDCIGSQIGLREIIKTSFPEKEVYAVGPMSDFVSFLGRMDEVEDDLFKDALSIIVDCGNEERVSDKRFSLAKETIKIDHHISSDDYADINYVREKSPSATTIITEFMNKYGLKVSLEGAKALYTGMITDTGRFRFDSVKGDTLRQAASLLDLGVNVAEIDNLLSVETLNEIKLKGYVLLNFETSPKGFAYMRMTRDIIERFNVTDEAAASMVSALSGIDGYPIFALFMEYSDEIRIRLRSRTKRIDILANKYGGGGHAKASGARLHNWEELDEFVKDVEKLLEE